MNKKNLLHLMAFLMVSMLSISTSSCNDDDEFSANSLIGKWEFYYTSSYDLDGNLLNEHDVEPGDFWIFQKNGTFEWEDSYDTERDTWKLEGNKLTLYGDEVYRILKLTKNELVVKMAWEDQGYREGIDGGYDYKIDKIRKLRRID